MSHILVERERYVDALEWVFERNGFDEDHTVYYRKLIEAYRANLARPFVTGPMPFETSLMPRLSSNDLMLFKLTFAI